MGFRELVTGEHVVVLGGLLVVIYLVSMFFRRMSRNKSK